MNIQGGVSIKQPSKTEEILLGLFLYISVVWSALLIARCWSGSLLELLQKLTATLQAPQNIT